MVVTAMESGTGTGAGTCTVEGVNTGQSDVVAMEMDVFSGEEVDSNPIPVARCRANTWHGRPILSVKEENSAEGAACGGKDGDLGPDGDAGADGVDTLGATEGSGGWRKGTTRRNAWGNLSYADLITKAIESAPEKRMTLSQIYGWMVQNISFFKDKGESNSSAGWKNSIRHNLSLHNRFMRVQNEGTGKSSWWMINPEAKTVKVPRRRAATMDTKTYSGKRGRAQRTVSLSTASSTTDLATKNEEFGEPRIEAAVFGSQDYRSGSTSGAGSLGGLSHMQAVEESEDVGDADFVSSSSMPMPWNSTYTTQENLDETLSESLADILVGSLSKEEMCSPENAPVAAIGQDATTLYPGASSTQCTFVTRDCPLTFPAASSHCPTFATHDNSSGKSIAARVNSQTFAQLPAFAGQQGAIGRLPDFGQQQQPDAVHLHFRSPVSPIDGSLRPPSFGNVFGNQTSELRQMNLRRLDDILRLRAASQKLYGQGELGIGQDVQTLGLAPSLGVGSHPILSPRLSPGSGATQRQLNSQLLLQLLASRPQLVAKMQHLLQTRQQQQHLLQQQLLNPSVQTVLAQSPTPSVSNRSGSMLQQLLVSSSTVDGIGTDAAAFHLNQIQSLAELSTSSMPSMSATSSVPPSNSSSPATSNFIPADLDLNFLDADAADIDCDIDQVIKHELTFGEKLDFSFDHTTDA